MSFCIKKYLVFSLRKSNNTKYYRTKVLGRPRPIPFFVLLWLAIEVSQPLSEIADVLFEIITYQKGWEYGGSSGVDA